MFDRLFRGGRGKGRGGQGGGGRGGGTKPGSGPGGNCLCPNCGHRIPHQVGQRCIDLACPKCGTKMIRE
jgi:electron transport complex protein RnfB